MKLLIEQIDDFLFKQNDGEEILELLKKKAFREVSKLKPKVRNLSDLKKVIYKELLEKYDNSNKDLTRIREFQIGDKLHIATVGYDENYNEYNLICTISNMTDKNTGLVYFNNRNFYVSEKENWPSTIEFKNGVIEEEYYIREDDGPAEVRFDGDSIYVKWYDQGFMFDEIEISGDELVMAKLNDDYWYEENLASNVLGRIFGLGAKGRPSLHEAKIDDHIARLPKIYEKGLYQYQDLEPKYIDWIFNQIHKVTKNLDELDKELFFKTITSSSIVKKIKQMVEDFDMLLRTRRLSGPERDIGRYTLASGRDNSLEDLILKHKEAIKEAEFRKKIKEKPDFKIIYEDDSYRIAKVNNVSAACRLPHGNWCTAVRSRNNMFEDYNNESDGFYYIEKIGQNNNVAVRTRKKSLTVTTHYNKEIEISISRFTKGHFSATLLYNAFASRCTIPPWVVEEILTYEGKM